MKSELAEFIESIGDELEMTESGKYRFVVSRMEFPPTATVETLKAHYNGRAMRRARVQRTNEQYDFSAHLPHIVPHKFMNEEKFLFCYLTSKTLPRNAEVVERHVAGKQYQRRLKESLEKKAEIDRIKERRKEKAAKAKEARRKKKLALKNGEDAADKDDATMDANGANDENNSADDASLPDDNDVDMEEAKVANGDAFKKAAENGFTGGAESMLTDTLAAALADSDAEGGDSSEDGSDDEKGGAEEEEADNFWTRGKHTMPAKKAEDAMDEGESDDAEEWATKKKPGAKGKRALARAGALSAGSKRKQAPPLPKKARQARRRRHSGASPTAVAGK